GSSPLDSLRSSLVSRHRQKRGEPWKARASESKGSVQARPAGITTSGADRVGPTRLRPVARAWKGSSLVLKPKCLHSYELLNNSTVCLCEHPRFGAHFITPPAGALPRDSVSALR